MPAGSAALAATLARRADHQRPAQRAGGAVDPRPVRRTHPAGAAGPARRPVRAVRPDRGRRRTTGCRSARNVLQVAAPLSDAADVASAAAAVTRDRAACSRLGSDPTVSTSRRRRHWARPRARRSPDMAAGSSSPPTPRPGPAAGGIARHGHLPGRAAGPRRRTRAPRCSAVPTASSSPPAMARCWPKPP